MSTWQSNQKAPQNSGKDDDKKSSKTGSVLRYMYKPSVGKNFSEIGRTMGVFPRLLAGVFAMQGMFPPNHPALRDENLRLPMTNVIATAFGSLQWNKQGIPKICFFFAVVGTLIFTVVGLFLAFTGIVTPAHALAPPPGIFDNTLGATDIANNWLNYLFQPAAGGVNFAVQVPNDAANGMATQTIQSGVAESFRVLAAMYSNAMLILAVLILVYHLVSMVVHTAHDGTPMGKSAHQVWAPIRLVFALGLLIPIGATGFSSGQFLVMQIAKWGSNMASNVWMNPAIGERVTGQASNLTTRPDVEAEGMISNLINIGYCAKSAQLKGVSVEDSAAFLGTVVTGVRNVADATRVADYDNAVYWDTVGGSQVQQGVAVTTPAGRRQPIISGAGTSVSAGANSKRYYPVAPAAAGGYNAVWDDVACGSVMHPAMASDGAMDATYAGVLQGIADSHVAAFNAIEQNALSVGATMAAAESKGGDLMALYGAGGTMNIVLAKQQLKQDYLNAFGVAVAANAPAATFNAATGIVTYVDNPTNAQKTAAVGVGGWMTAGGWFSSLAGKHNSFSKAAQIVPEVKAFCDDGKTDCGEDVLSAQTEQNTKNIAAANQEASENGGGMIMKAVNAVIMPMLKFVGLANNQNQFIWQTKFTSNSPVSDMIGLGSTLIDGAVHLIEIGVVFNLAGALGNLVGGAGGLTTNETGGFKGALLKKSANAVLKMIPIGKVRDIIATVGSMMSVISPLLFGIASMIMLPGIFLFYVLPFLPFINFVTGVITWLISLLQAVVAIPIIAIAHLSPNGEGLPSNSARGAYTMLLQIFLRPVMMIFGMLATILIMNTGIGFLNTVFFNIYKANMVGNADGLLSSIIFMILYAGAAWGIVNAAVTAIDDFPLKAVTWIGGGQGVDTNHDLKGVAMLGAGAAVQQGMGSITRGLQSASSMPSQGISSQIGANQSIAASRTASTQAYNAQMARQGHMGDTSAAGQQAQAHGNASILPNHGNNAPPSMTPPTPHPGGPSPGSPPALGSGAQPRLGGPSGSGNGGSVVPSGPGGPGNNGSQLPPGFTRMSPTESAAARMDKGVIENAAVQTGGSAGSAGTGFIQAAGKSAAGTSRPAAGSAAWVMTQRGSELNAAATRHGIPSAFLAAQQSAESGHKGAAAVSSVGARGSAQFMPATAKQYGITDFNNETQMANAQGHYMADLKKMYHGDMVKATAAYNWGQGNVNKAIKAHGDDWLTHAPAETQNYVQKIDNRMQSDFGTSLAAVSTNAPSGITPQAEVQVADAESSSSGGGGMLSTGAHLVLGGLSFIPGVSVISGGLDAALYTAEGDYVNAGISAVGMIPGGKWVTTGGKLAFRGAKLARGAGTMAREMKMANAMSPSGGSSSSSGGGRAPVVDDGADAYTLLLSAKAMNYIANSGKKQQRV